MPEFVDERFRKMIAEKRPKGEYYSQTMGDKLLYLKRIDGLDYDVVEQEQLRLQRKLEEELEMMRKKL